MPELKPAGAKRSRAKYSRLICLGCRERRIRCELPSEVEVPSPGELKTVHTPCYRCKRLGIPCVVRQTILGRSNPENSSTTAADLWPAKAGDIVSRIIIELPSHVVACSQPNTVRTEAQPVSRADFPRIKWDSQDDQLPREPDPESCDGGTLLIHKPQSSETVTIIRAIDTLRCEKVEEEWFRHLGAHVGHTQALDMSIKAIVVASAYRRGIPKLTTGDCYQALALALNAVQVRIKQSKGDLDDDILAATALLAPFEGVVKRHGIPTRLHVEGLAAILAARSASYPVSQLAREMVDFNACESAIMACVQNTPSPFEGVSRAYYTNDRICYSDGDRAQLKALRNELFIQIPQLVKLVRSLRTQPSPQIDLHLEAMRLSEALSALQDSPAEKRLLQNVKVNPSSNPNCISPRRQSFHFASVQDFEALAYYWQGRLSLLRLQWRLHSLTVSSEAKSGSADDLESASWPGFPTEVKEMFRLVENILMSSEYTRTLPLHKHSRMLFHAMVVVWGVTMDMPGAIGLYEKEEGRAPLSDLLLGLTNTALAAAKSDLTVEDMNTAADIFVGGQPMGKFAELFGL